MAGHYSRLWIMQQISSFTTNPRKLLRYINVFVKTLQHSSRAHTKPDTESDTWHTCDATRLLYSRAFCVLRQRTPFYLVTELSVFFYFLLNRRLMAWLKYCVIMSLCFPGDCNVTLGFTTALRCQQPIRISLVSTGNGRGSVNPIALYESAYLQTKLTVSANNSSSIQS